MNFLNFPGKIAESNSTLTVADLEFDTLAVLNNIYFKVIAIAEDFCTAIFKGHMGTTPIGIYLVIV